VSLNRALFTSRSATWETPDAAYSELDAEYGFTIDVCAEPHTSKCKRYYTKEDDALGRSWAGEVCWMNPPYGRQIGRWVRKAYEESQGGATVVCLIPSRTDTAWWHDYVMRGEVYVIRGRLRFGDATNGAPFPSAVVVFKGVQL